MKATAATQSNRETSRFVMRPYRRIPTRYLSYYMSGDYVGKGVVKNLSRTGMRLAADHAIKLGTFLTIRVMIEEGRPPLEIERVLVRWVSEGECGMKISAISPAAAQQIKKLVTEPAKARRGNV